MSRIIEPTETIYRNPDAGWIVAWERCLACGHESLCVFPAATVDVRECGQCHKMAAVLSGRPLEGDDE